MPNRKFVTGGLTFCLFSTFAAIGLAQTPVSGELFMTTYQNQGGNHTPLTTNVWKLQFSYDSVSGLVLGAPVAVATLTGADGIIFDPNDPTNNTLIVGEQNANANMIASLQTDGSGLIQKTAGGGQAYALTATPDGSQVIALPNDPAPLPDANDVVLAPLPFTKKSGNGIAYAVTGDDTALRGVTFIGPTAYYGDAGDVNLGHFGIFDLTTLTTTRSTIIDDVNGIAGQGSLPSGGVLYDPFSQTIILTSGNLIWQLKQDQMLSNTFHIVAELTTAAVCAPPCFNQNNWDQTAVDGLGHMFSANNDGDLIFIDYSGSATKSITDPNNYVYLNFLIGSLDDVAMSVTPSGTGRMTGGGSVFTADGTRVTHGFELHCNAGQGPNNLEINWGGNQFHLDSLTSAYCFQNPAINAAHPTDIFNTYVGTGVGSYDGVPGATISWTFTDAGEPGTNDMATITISNASGQVLFVSGLLDDGNQQAHQ